MAVTPASDTYDRISLDDALHAARQALEDACDGWAVNLTAQPGDHGFLQMRVEYAPPTEH